jgi:hypothetical protein
MIDLPQREGKAGTGKVGESGGAVQRAEAEALDVECHRPFKILDEETNIGNRVTLGKLHDSLLPQKFWRRKTLLRRSGPETQDRPDRTVTEIIR